MFSFLAPGGAGFSDSPVPLRAAAPTRGGFRVRPQAQDAASVLWVDDAITSADAVVHGLERIGFAVDCTQTGDEAIRLIANHPYDAILLDLRLRDESGVDLLERLVNDGLDAPVVVVSAVTDVATAVAAMKLGSADYVTKPVDVEFLGSRLRRVLAATDGAGARGRPAPPDREWLTVHAERLSECATREDAVALTLHVLADRELPLTMFWGCADALRSLLTTAETSTTLVVSDARRALLRAAKTEPPSHPRIRSALEALETAECKLSQQVFATRTGLSRAYLSHLFASHTGRKASDWSRAGRMRAAIRRIVRTNEQISQIAYRAGYDHAGQFDRDCVAVFGASPTALRRLGTSRI
jgi:DNA-binding response OmpR family regulator/AraC-like DNA-binding protein